MFVCGVNPKNIVVLGGNQGGGGAFGGTIDFAEFEPSEIHGYYVSETHLPFAQQEIAKGGLAAGRIGNRLEQGLSH